MYFYSICRATQLTKGCNKAIGPWLLTLCHNLSLDIPLRLASLLFISLSHETHRRHLAFVYFGAGLFYNFFFIYLFHLYAAAALLWFEKQNECSALARGVCRSKHLICPPVLQMPQMYANVMAPGMSANQPVFQQFLQVSYFCIHGF